MRAAALATLASFLLAGAGHGAGARFAPRLRAELGRSLGNGPALVLDVAQTTSQPALARVTFVVPPGQPFKAPQAGVTVGDAAVAVVPTTGRSRAPSLLSGQLKAGGPQSAAAKGCVRHPTASLTAKLSADDTGAAIKALTLRLFVHTHRGTTRLTACLPRQAALAGRGAVRRLALRLVQGLGSAPSGTSIWRGLFTPVGRRGGAAAYPATTESRGIVVSPAYLTLQGPLSPTATRGTRILARGTLSYGQAASPGRRIQVMGGAAVLARTRTGARGSYAVLVKVPARPGPLVLQARLPSRLLRCGGRTADAPSGCTSATLAGVSSNALRIFVR